MHPARIGVFFVLLPHAQRDVVVDRRQARDRGAQRAFLQRFAQLLRQDVVERRRPGSCEQRLRNRQRMQRPIHRQRRELHRRDGARRSRRRARLEPLDLRVLVRRGCENIFIDEALLGERAAERKRRVVAGRVAGGGRAARRAAT